MISVNSCDSSVESVASYDEHVCSAKSQKRPAENYLQAQQKEIELQRELYGKFEPSGIFDKNREYQLKQQQLVSAQNRRREDAARKFLAQNSEQLEAEAQEKN